MMSDQSTTIEIEDVLSSIRRLVSQDSAMRQSAMPHRSALPEARRPVPDPAAALVLTPAQRVAPSEAPRLELAPEAAPEAAPEMAAEMAAELPPLAQADTPEPAAEPADAPMAMMDGPGAAEDFVLAPQDAAPQAEPELEAEPEAGFEAEAEASQDMTDATWPQDPEDVEMSAEADLGEELTRLESKIAEMEAAVAESDTDFEPEQGDHFAPEGAAPLSELPEEFDAAAFSPQEAAPTAPEEQPGWDEQDAAPAADAGLPPLQEVEVVDEGRDAGDLEDPDLRHESWVRADRADWDEDLRAETEEAVTAVATEAAIDELRHLSLEDAVEAPVAHAARETSYQALREDMALEDAEPEAEERFDIEAAGLPIDEADLRDLVAEIIRQELQGTLGERITRNVRKLVRREIQRALLSRDME
ncbi:MAG: hypothetical protein R3D78_10715 [Paracoccaceae bacterium]